MSIGHPQDTCPSPTNSKPRELDDLLHHHQNILDRLAGFDDRLRELKARLSGDSPTVSTEGLSADIPGGIMGQLHDTHSAADRRCDSIAEWLDLIEKVV